MVSDSDNVINNFIEFTSLHGINKAADDSGRVKKIRRVIWAILLLLSVVGVVVILCYQLKDYTEFKTRMQTKYVFQESLQFPAVTICSLNRFYNRNLSHTQLELGMLYDIAVLKFQTDQPIDKIYKALLNNKSIMQNNKSLCFMLRSFHNRNLNTRVLYHLKCSNQNKYYNLTYAKIKKMGFDIESSLKKCSFGSKWKTTCSYKDFKPVYSVKYGLCWTFNGIGQKSWSQTVGGLSNGLHLILYNPQQEFMRSFINLGKGAGYKIIIHPKHEPPNGVERGIFLGPGNQHFLEMEMIKTSYIQPPWGKCEEKNLSMYKTYSKMAAINECYEKLTTKHCNCSMVLGNFTLCSPKSIINCVSRIKWGNNTDTKETDLWRACHKLPHSCRHTWYKMTTSSVKWPDEVAMTYYKKLLNKTFHRIHQDYTAVDIYYPNMMYHKYSQSKAMDIATLAGQMGGTLGLFLGASIMTLIEIVEFCILFCKSLYDTKRTNNTKLMNQNVPKAEKHFTTTESRPLLSHNDK